MSDSTITVTALDRRMEFKDVGALREHVEELLEHRGSVFAPMDLACVRALVASSNGSTPEEAARIARKTAIFSPGKPERGPSPLDEKLEASEERLERAEAELAEAFQHREQVRTAADAEVAALRAKAKGTPSEIGREVSDLRGRLRVRIEDASAEYLRARESRTRACARVNALRVARDRWHSTESMTLHSND